MPPESIKADTEYVVLKKPAVSSNAMSGGPQGWSIIGTFDGRDATTAIKAAVGEPLTDGVSGNYVAVPSRSWKPVTVDVKVEKTLVLGEAS